MVLNNVSRIQFFGVRTQPFHWKVNKIAKAKEKIFKRIFWGALAPQLNPKGAQTNPYEVVPHHQAFQAEESQDLGDFGGSHLTTCNCSYFTMLFLKPRPRIKARTLTSEAKGGTTDIFCCRTSPKTTQWAESTRCGPGQWANITMLPKRRFQVPKEDKAPQDTLDNQMDY